MSSRKWVIDKRVPVVTIVLFVVTFVVNAMTLSWYASKMESRLTTLESQESLNAVSRAKVLNLEGSLQSMNTMLESIKNDQLRDIKTTLDHMIWDKQGTHQEGGSR